MKGATAFYTFKLIIYLHFISIIAVSSFPFKPLAPPRFDTFTESILGKWKGKNDGSSEVEEVMRSCGGAVQGIRDISLLQDDDDDEGEGTIYHNRADDGFVYWECGSYTAGPVQLQTHGLNYMVTSHSFGKKRRVLSHIAMEGDSGEIQHEAVSLLLRPSAMSEETEQTIITPSSWDESCELLSKVVWNHEALCRMPSSSQKWMLQRVKWEQNAINQEDSTEPPIAEDFLDSFGSSSSNHFRVLLNDVEHDSVGSLFGWVVISPSSAMQQKNNLWGSDDLKNTVGKENKNDGISIQMGAVCLITGETKASIRNYGSSGALQCVALQQGNMRI